MPPRLSIVVVHFRDPRALEGCLQSMEKTTEAGTTEIIVVDNHTPGWDSRSWEKKYPGVCFVARGDNGGYAVAVNAGLRRATGAFVLILNCDTLIHPHALDRMCRFLEAHPRAGVIGCQIQNADGHVDLSYRAFPHWWTPLVSRYSPLTLLWPGNPWSNRYLFTREDHTTAKRVDWISGACMMVPRQALEQVGGLDEGFFMYMEDVDFCLRMHNAGWEVWYVPEAVISHTGGTGNDQRKFASIVEHHKSIWRYYQKHVHSGWMQKPFIFIGVLLRLGYEITRTWIKGCFRARGGPGYREAYLKRPIDMGMAFIGLVVTFPLWCMAPLLIWLQDRGPIFYKQPRVGRNGRVFQVFKFRTMRADADQLWGPAQTRKADPRVTPVGRWLRRSAIDEIPQLVNILKGDMSLVGPRALMAEEVETNGHAVPIHLTQIPGWNRRALMRPGLTGIAQVFARRDLPRRQKFRYDLLYLQGQSILFDLYLIGYSIAISLSGRWERRGESSRSHTRTLKVRAEG